MIDTAPVVQILTANTFTVGDMRRRLGLLQECVELALFTDETTDAVTAIKAAILERGREDDVAAVTAWDEALFSLFTATNIAEHMSALHEAVDALPELTLYIPVSFPEKELADIAVWCREECAPLLLLDVHIDPKVVGGCAFVWNDAYHDFSFQAQVKKYPGVITQQLNTYV
jgi:hypothetical protein